MAKVYEIRLAVGGMAEAAQAMADMGRQGEAYARQGEQLGRQLKELKDSAAKVPEAAVPKYLQGPHQRLEKIREQLGLAAERSDEAALADLKLLEERVQRQLDRLANPPAPAAKPTPLPEPDVPKFLQGPNQRLARIREQMALAEQLDNQEALADLKILEFRAERSKRIGEKRLDQGEEALNAPGLLDLFQELTSLLRGGGGFSLTTVAKGIQLLTEPPGGLNVQQKLANSIGTSVAPLKVATDTAAGLKNAAVSGDAAAASAGALADMAGMATTQVGALAVGLALAVAEVKLFSSILQTSMQRLKEMGDARLVSGGTRGQMALLQAMGFGPGQIAGVAGALRGTASSDPMAMLALQRLGVGPVLPQAFGSQNNAAILLEVVDAFGRVSDESEKLRLAHMLQLESYLPLIDVAHRHRDSLQRDAQAYAALANPRYTRAAQDLSFQAGRIQEQWGNLVTALGAPFLETAGEYAELLADGLADAAHWLAENEWAIDAVVTAGMPMLAVLKEIPDIFRAIADMSPILRTAIIGMTYAINPLLGIVAERFLAQVARGRQREDDARREHTDAMREHARILRQGTFGGGERVRGALPAGLDGMALSRALEEGGRLNGAWAL